MKKATPKKVVKSNAPALLSSASRIMNAEAAIPGGIQAAFTLRQNSKLLGVTELQFADTLIEAKNHYAFMQQLCFNLSRNAGWHGSFRSGDGMGGEQFATKVALIHSELSEALEGFRKSKMDDHLPHRPSVEVELADAVIRIMDLSGALGIDVAGAIIEKLNYNQHREDHKIYARAGEGGKKF